VVNGNIVLNAVASELEGVWPRLAEVEQGEGIERQAESHLENGVSLRQCDECGEEDGAEDVDIGAEEREDVVAIDALEGEDVLVVDLGVVHVPQVYLLLLGKEDVS